jgi:hypothetical protein
MKPLWLLQEGNFARDGQEQRLKYTIQELGMEVIQIQYVPFGGTDYSFLPNNQPVVFHGSLNMIHDFQKRSNNCKPFAWCDWDLLSCKVYYAYYGKYLLQQVYGFYPLGEIRRLKDFLYKTYSRQDRDEIFIRPDANNKTFQGGLVKHNMFNSYIAIAADYDQKPECLCVVSRPERINCEWRFVVARKKVITGSQYMDGNAFSVSPIYPDSAVVFVEEAIKEWQPHPIFVVDVAATDCGYKIVEIGMINGAGFYDCDYRRIVETCSEIAVEEFVQKE